MNIPNTKGNYGLYFTDSTLDIKVIRIADMVFDVKITDYEFEGLDCDTILQLNDDKTVLFVYLSSDEEITSGISWRERQSDAKNMLVISSGGEKFKYEVKNFIESDKFSKTYSARLSPMEFYRLPFGCQYSGVFRLSQ